MLVRRLGEPWLAAGGGFVIVTSMCVIALAHAPIVAALMCLTAGLGFYMLHNTLQVNATQMAPAQRGSSVALFAASLFMGQSTGVSLAGYTAERTGTGPVILACAAGVLALALFFAAARRRHAVLQA